MRSEFEIRRCVAVGRVRSLDADSVFGGISKINAEYHYYQTNCADDKLNNPLTVTVICVQAVAVSLTHTLGKADPCVLGRL